MNVWRATGVTVFSRQELDLGYGSGRKKERDEREPVGQLDWDKTPKDKGLPHADSVSVTLWTEWSAALWRQCQCCPLETVLMLPSGDSISAALWRRCQCCPLETVSVLPSGDGVSAALWRRCQCCPLETVSVLPSGNCKCCPLESSMRWQHSHMRDKLCSNNVATRVALPRVG